MLLSVTPHINENGLVTMAVYQEVSEPGEDVNVAGENYPSFFKRSVDTTLTSSHEVTIRGARVPYEAEVGMQPVWDEDGTVAVWYWETDESDSV